MPHEIVPKKFKEMIINELILPSYRENIQYTIRTRSCWSIVCTICLTSSTILIGVSSLLSFASSSFPDANMGFIAGSVGIFAVLMKEFSSYANSQDHLKTVEMNEILKNIGIDFKFEDTSGLESQLIASIHTNSAMPQASPVLTSQAPSQSVNETQGLNATENTVNPPPNYQTFPSSSSTAVVNPMITQTPVSLADFSGNDLSLKV